VLPLEYIVACHSGTLADPLADVAGVSPSPGAAVAVVHVLLCDVHEARPCVHDDGDVAGGLERRSRFP
jgi:hypothetical protein